MGSQLPLESNPLLVRERREHTWGNMHRQLSFVMFMVSATNASVLIVCCRKHCRFAAVCVSTLTVMGRLRWKACSKVWYKSGRIIVPGREPFSTNKQEDHLHTYRVPNTQQTLLVMVINSSIVCWVAWRPLSSFIFRLIATVSLLLRYCSRRVGQYLLSCQLVIDLPQLTGTVTGGQ